MYKVVKKGIFFCLAMFLTAILFSLNMVSAAGKSIVSERELLMLSVMSYSNRQTENVCDMTADKEFNRKRFCGYGDAAELVGWKVKDALISEGTGNQDSFSVVSYKKDNNLVIAFRGTDDGIVNENWNYILPYTEHPQAKYVREYISKLENADFIDDNTKIYCTGHSLGGYLTLYGVGLILQSECLSSRFVRAVTFNGLGLGYVNDKDMIKKLSSLNDGSLTNYRIFGDMVSNMGEHFTKMKTFKFIYDKNNKVGEKKTLKNPHCPHNFLMQKLFCK